MKRCILVQIGTNSFIVYPNESVGVMRVRKDIDSKIHEIRKLNPDIDMKVTNLDMYEDTESTHAFLDGFIASTRENNERVSSVAH